jgi:hypothetical protein
VDVAVIFTDESLSSMSRWLKVMAKQVIAVTEKWIELAEKESAVLNSKFMPALI